MERVRSSGPPYDLLFQGNTVTARSFVMTGQATANDRYRCQLPFQ
jgi:hypothetical protein